MKNVEEALPEKVNLKIWLKIGKYALRYWPIILLTIFAMLVTSWYDSALVPTLNASVIESTSAFATLPLEGNVLDVPLRLTFIEGILEFSIPFWGFLLLEVTAILLRSVAVFTNFYFSNILSMRIMTDLRRDCFKKVQQLSFSYFDRVNSGWLIARMNNDTASLGDTLSQQILQIFWSIFDILFTLVSMFSRSWIFALIVLASTPFVMVLVPLLQKLLLVRWRKARNAYSYFVGWLAEVINGSKTIRTLAVEEEVSQEAEGIISDVEQKRYKASRVNAYLTPSLQLLSGITTAIVVLSGIFMIQGGGDEETIIALSATIVLFISFVGNIYNPLQSFSELASEIMASQAGAEKVGQLLDEVPEVQDRDEIVERFGTSLAPKEEEYSPLNGTIDFKEVSFHYANGIEVIHPLSLHIEAGTSLAIVGETGSGKTTLVNLLCRFYEPTGGDILLDGVSYRDRSLHWLHSNIGYVQQSPFAFKGTYFENIAYGKEDATLKEVREAAKIVGIDDEIMSLKDGYNTYLEEGGGSLSQGQKQLLSFARALVRNPSILILDEATSSIDTETEALVQNALLKLLKGRTSISIAHRLSTIVHCDRILVMQEGNIIEEGNHKQLMQRKGYYYQLYMNQFRDLDIGEQVKTYESQIEGEKY